MAVWKAEPDELKAITRTVKPESGEEVVKNAGTDLSQHGEAKGEVKGMAMARFLRALVVLLVVAVVALFLLLENADSYTEQLSSALEAATGYEVNIGGPLSWDYWPPFSLRADYLSLAVPGQFPLLEISLTVNTNLLPLLFGKAVVDIQGIQVLSGQAFLIENNEGENNWAVRAATSQSAQGAKGAEFQQRLPRIGNLTISNFTVSYEPAGQGAWMLDIDRFELQGAKQGAPASFALSATLSGLADQLASNFSAKGSLRYDKASLELMEMTLTHHTYHQGLDYPPISHQVSGSWSTEQGHLRLDHFTTSMDGLTAVTPVALNARNLTFSASIDRLEADLTKLASVFGVASPFSSLSATGQIRGSQGAVHIESLAAQLDDGNMAGKLSFAQAPEPAIEGDLRIDLLDLSAAAPANSQEPARASQGAELIPLELLRRFNIKLVARAEQLKLDSWDLQSVKVEVNNNTKQLEALASAQGLDGKLLASMTTDLSGVASSHLTLTTNGISASQLMKGLSGKLQTSSELTFAGSRLGELTDTLTGKSTFNITDGKLDVRPIKRMALAIDTARGKRSSLSDWPDQLPFKRITGQHYFAKGTRSNQVFMADLSNLAIQGQGGFDLTADTLDYRISIQLQQTDEGAFKVSDELAGIRWPLVCQGKISASPLNPFPERSRREPNHSPQAKTSDSPLDLCFGREGAIATLVSELIRQSIKRQDRQRLDEFIEHSLPQEYREPGKKLLDKLRR